MQLVAGCLDEEPVRHRLIEYLHRIQDAHGCLTHDHLLAVAEHLAAAPVEVFETASFYHHFDIVPDEQAAPPALTIRVCNSITCSMHGGDQLAQALRDLCEPTIRIQAVPCVGRCAEAPVAVVGRRPLAHADPAAVIQAVDSGVFEDTVPSDAIGYAAYRDQGGYRQLRRLQQADATVRDSLIAALHDARLRGLGGAGFPLARKWDIVRRQPAPRLLAVNIDEGEPGTFKDRHILERNPHRFLEGMFIAADVVGTEKIFIYLRDEYAGIRALLQRELAALLDNPPCVLPPVELRRGAGAYVCGEESAMLESIEGKRGMPRLRPPYIAERGLFGRPTLEHNMETLYWVPEILDRGAAWFAGQGINGRHGLRSFSLSGRIKRPGVYIAPAGISARRLIDDYAGGMLDGQVFKAYFPGGASGGILPASLGDLPLDFDTLQDHGCFIGSAAVIVLSDRDSVREMATNAMRFFADESCGRCTPCRVGTRRAADMMGRAVWDRASLDDLCQVMQDASICGLGQAAPNPLRCAMRYFPEEF
jgi:formate dehydrogenase